MAVEAPQEVAEAVVASVEEAVVAEEVEEDSIEDLHKMLFQLPLTHLLSKD